MARYIYFLLTAFFLPVIKYDTMMMQLSSDDDDITQFYIRPHYTQKTG